MWRRWRRSRNGSDKRKRSPKNPPSKRQMRRRRTMSVPLSNRIRAGQNQIAMHERYLKAANDRVQESEQSIVAAQKSLQHRAKVEDIEKALQERRNHLEQLHRQAAAEASHGAETTQLEIMFPDGITKHVPKRRRTASKKQQTSVKKSARPRQQRKRRPHVRPAKEADDPTCRLKPEVTQKDWQYCGHRWPGTSAHRCRRRN